jgi:hypothetical protein
MIMLLALSLRATVLLLLIFAASWLLRSAPAMLRHRLWNAAAPDLFG